MSLRMVFSVAIIAYIINTTIAQTESVATSGLYFGNQISARMRENNLLQNVRILTKSPSTSLERCIEECNQREECGYIYFVRRWAMCYMLQESNVSMEPEDRLEYGMSKPAGAVFGVKGEWRDQTVSEQSTTDPLPIVCGPQPQLPNAVRRGNMYQVGSKVMYQCEEGLTSTGEEAVFTTCEPGGNWKDVAIQCIDHETLDRCNTTGDMWLRNDSCYILNVDNHNYRDAKDNCGIWGGQLVTIEDQAEQLFIEKMLTHYVDLEQLHTDDMVYTGYYKSDFNSTVYNNWEMDEPSQNRHCVALKGKQNSYPWMTVKCASLYLNSLCEIDLT